MSKAFEGSKAFLNVPIGIARDKDLLKKPKTILLMGEIVSMLNVTGEFFMSNKKIASRLDVTTRTVSDYLDILEHKRLISREKVVSDENGAIIGRKIRAGADLVKYISIGWGNVFHGGSEADFYTLVKPTSHKKNRDNRTINRTEEDINSSPAKKQDEPPIPYKEIIDYLNQKTGTHYKSSSKATRALIRARWKERYRLEDFKKVIDNKTFSWQNTDMWKYMRPSTLFRESKFDTYLNENNLNLHKDKPTSGGYGGVVDISSIPDDELPF